MSEADDKEAVDRAFAELVAGYHLTAERPEPPAWEEQPPESGSVFEPPRPVSGVDLPADVELASLEPPTVEPPASRQHHASLPEERFEPGPPPPLPRLAWPALLGWIGMGYAMLTVLAIAVGFRLPAWAAWISVLGFVGGFALLVSRLPRSRPPDAGDGAVL